MHCVVTLVERDYLYGACVLYNSLIRNGFEGLYVIGYRNRDSLPARPLQALEQQSSKVQFIELNTPLHFTNFKPAFIRQVLDSQPECMAITYIDPDIVVDAPANWILSWCEGGPAACADVNWWMPAQHPTRRQWLARTGLKASHQLELYFNGGFLSLLREDRGFLDLWKQLIEQNEDKAIPLNVQGEIGDWRRGGRWLPFFTPDQDALNIALMAWKGPITALGPDVMGFSGAAFMPHALGTPKPWQKHYISDTLKGKPPRQVDKLFWAYAGYPLEPFSNLFVALKVLCIQLASLLGRFYQRR
jgi:hypothetical protein